MLIDALLDGLKARLETISDLTVTTDPGATIVVPMAAISDDGISYDAAFGRGRDVIDVKVRVYVSLADSSTGVGEAREYLSGHGARSIRAALVSPVGGSDDLSTAGVDVNPTEGAAGKADALQGGSFVVADVSVITHVSGTT